MALHAARNVGAAATVTRDFLTPIEFVRWLKLAVVAFFIGGGMSLPSTQFNASGGPETIPAGEIPLALPAETATLIAAAVAIAVGLGLLFAVVGAIMEFVFIESLRTGSVSIRRHWSERWRQGLRLFGFRIAIVLPVAAITLGWLALFFVPLATEITDPIVPFGVFFLGLPVLFLVGLLYALVASFTTVFVVPIMIKDDCGVVAGWRSLWRSIKSDPKQYLAYAVLAFLLTVAAGILASLVVGIGVALLLIPLVIIALIMHFTVSLSSTVGLVALVAIVVLFLAAVFVLWALVQVPVVAYLRYYALLVLGDIEPSFDLIADRRSELEQ